MDCFQMILALPNVLQNVAYALITYININRERFKPLRIDSLSVTRPFLSIRGAYIDWLFILRI